MPGWTKEQLENLKKGNVGAFADFETLIAPHEEEKPSKIEEVPLTQEEMSKLTKGIVYYTDNRIDPELAKKVQASLIRSGLPIVSVSLKPMDFGENIVLDKERSYLTMFEQTLAGIERSKTDIIFLCEHDVIYSNEHFQFTPTNADQFFYNMNNWQVRQSDGHAVYWIAKKVSQCCGYRELMLRHYTERVRKVKETGFSRRMGFEPGTHRRPERVDDTTSLEFRTVIPNLDVRHRYNLTASRWSPDQFRNPCKDWTESHVNKLPGWEEVVL